LDDSLLAKHAETIFSLKKDGLYPNQKDADISDSTAVEYALDNILYADQKIDADAIYADMEKELSEDEKLSAEARKKLPKSVFCGPDKSFPVPDCAHVTAARRLIGRYKGPGDKASILACVNRKAKTLGCDSESKESTDTPTVKGSVKFSLPTCENLKDLPNEDAQTLFAMAEAELIERNLKVQRECAKCAESEDLLKKEQIKAEDAIKKAEDAENTLSVVRDEYRLCFKDFSNLADDNMKIQEALETQKKEYFALVSVLKGANKDTKEAFNSFEDKTVEQLEASVMTDFDLSKVTDKLNDGMSRTPVGEVNNPALEENNSGEFSIDGLSEVGYQTVKNIKTHLKNNNESLAEQLYFKAVQYGVLPDSIKLENIKSDETD
jgi:hypothetical protein